MYQFTGRKRPATFLILMSHSERGVALLEVLIALAILSMGGLGTVAVVDSAIRSQADMAQRENTIRTAGRVLAALTLLKPNELTQRLGKYRLGEFVVGISRPEPALFRVALSEVQAPEHEVLVTVVYRP